MNVQPNDLVFLTYGDGFGRVVYFSRIFLPLSVPEKH